MINDLSVKCKIVVWQAADDVGSIGSFGESRNLAHTYSF